MIKRQVLFAAASVAAVLASPAMAQSAGAGGARSATPDPSPLEQVVVTASPSGSGIATNLLGSSVTVIDAQAVEARQVRVVSDLLRDVPGVSVSRSGPLGAQTQVRIRGAEGNHTVVLVDGVLAADPSQGEFDFSTLYADEGSHVEVLRGQQPIYGSNAIAGVIHYITATGAESPGLSARLEGGSFNTAQGSVRYGGVSGPFDFNFSAGYFTTDGTPNGRFSVRDLDDKNNTVSGKVIITPVKNFRIVTVGRYAETTADTSPSDFGLPSSSPRYGLPNDGTNYYTARQRMGLVRAELDLFEGRWTQGVGVQGNGTRRRSFTAVNSPASFSNAARTKLTYDTTFKFETGDVRHTLTGLVDRDLAAYRSLPLGAGPVTSQFQRREINNTGLVAQYDLDWDGRLGLGAAVRRDHNTRFDNATTYRVQASYSFDQGTRLRAAAGSGITNPTFTELYGFNPATFIGNPDLKPERSRGWEAGADQTLFDNRLKLGVTYFTARLHDEIFTNFTPTFVSTPANRASLSKQQGWELTAAARLGRQWRFDGAYTNLHATERGIREIRRPDNTASGNLTWRSLDDRFGGTLTVRYNGKMTDTYFGATSQTKVLKAFTLVNLNADVKLTRQIGLYGRVENAFNEKYEEVYGYTSVRRGFYAGVKASL